MTEHTPTPWKVSMGSTHITGICKFESIHGMYPNYEANAQFIVKAVNAHDALIEALARIRDFPHDRSECEQAMAQIAYDAVHAAVSSQKEPS